MHIPDGFLATPVWATLDVVSLPIVGWVARRARADADESRTPLLGVLGAFVFAAQMINFPIAPGTSAHLLGGALLACTVGPAASMIVLTAVLVIQALVFQDGGLLALGANVFNIAIVGSLAGYLPFWLLHRNWRSGGLFLGGMLSVFLSGVCALMQLMFSGVGIPPPVMWGALAMFAVSSVVEGIATVAVVRAIDKISPARVQPAQDSPAAQWILAGIAAVLAGLGFLIASGSPDSLEAIAERTGIAVRETHLLSAPMADYAVQGVALESVARAAAGIMGIVLVYLAVVAVSRALRRSA